MGIPGGKARVSLGGSRQGSRDPLRHQCTPVPRWALRTGHAQQPSLLPQWTVPWALGYLLACAQTRDLGLLLLPPPPHSGLLHSGPHRNKSTHWLWLTYTLLISPHNGHRRWHSAHVTDVETKTLKSRPVTALPSPSVCIHWVSRLLGAGRFIQGGRQSWCSELAFQWGRDPGQVIIHR